MRGRRLIDDALASQGLAVTPQTRGGLGGYAARPCGYRALGQHRAAHLGPHSCYAARDFGASALHEPSIIALLALVTHAAEPGSPVTRALVQTAREAGIAAVFNGRHAADVR